MGKKRTWKRKHLLLHLTGCIIISLGFNSCADYPKIFQGGSYSWDYQNAQVSEQIHAVRQLVAAGDFEASLAKSEELLRRYRKSYGDQALFQIGLIYAHPKNPHGDLQKALGNFQTLQNEFPASALSPEAGIWVSVLEKISKQNEKLSLLHKDYDNDTKKLTHDISNLKAGLKKKENQIKKQQVQIVGLTAEVENLEKKIALLKEVDIKIEEKKRKEQKNE